ncbi:Rho GTPase activation protein [Teratosphaeria nubilosa]|uniref:Rho GTPase activation protein n=1 Tax=Teratosphaeria nubilosa TaxID=161662 RepID=A0A6G1KTW2_9PEZI|nr:Rho GTPase activation protein [Teratosphaeria nubilosa]
MLSETVGSIPTVLPPANARRIVHLMKTMNGRMSGSVVFRRGVSQPWSQSFCYVQEDTGSLMYEPRGGEDVHKTLIQDLRGWRVIPNVEDETPYLEVTLPGYEDEIHFKVQTQTDFDAWFAAFMWWQTQSTSSSAHGRDRAGSTNSDRRRSAAPNHQKEAPVIKIGKMIFWDTNVAFSISGETSLSPPTTARPQAHRTQSYGSRRFRRISGQLRENGELKLHSDADNSLISVVQLSQLSRCAIQRLDPTVMDNDFCIAIYPQYTAGSNSNHQPGFVRPIFLSLENRVLHEVWFVLLRAFTMPQLYGPPRHEDEETDGQHDSGMHSSTDEMFRVERSMSIRIVEAKMYPPTSVPPTNEAGFSGGHNQGTQAAVKPEQHGYYAEVLLDDETRGKTAVKHEGLTPLWGESFEFQDLPPVLGSASVVIKRRPPDNVYVRQQNESKLAHEKHGFTNDQNGGYTGITFDVTCGKVEIYLQELEEQKEVEKWWGVFNMYETRVGDVLIKARAEEGVILMAKDYQPLSDLLHHFSNGLTLQIAQMLPGELKRLSDCLLNIYQVSGKAGDWIQAMVEEEIDGIHRETPISRLRYSRRVGSEGSGEGPGYGHKEPTNSDRELIVRDMNKNATLEANLLFRGNTLLTKSLDTHMRRVGREYLEQCLAAQIHEINDKDMDCEVDPNRVSSQTDLDRNWRRLLGFTQDVWKAILAAKSQCPVELRTIFRHIRACAEDRYGDFLRTVQYSSVSGFLFLRFFCPAVLNPKLFGLLKEDIRPRSRRTFTLIAKSLQTLANMASFGTKEQWMEPMNFFLTQNRESFKNFIDDICYVPAPASNSSSFGPTGASPNYSTGLVSAETHLSYTTPMTIMQRLPATSREGFPSLPYLIDQARAFAELVQLWIDTTSPPPAPDNNSVSSKRHSEIINAINASDGDMVAFHATCVNLSRRTQECLNRAERAERPNSELSFRIEGLLDQLPSARTTEESSDDLADHTYDPIADRIASDPSILPPGMDSSSRVGNVVPPRQREWSHITDEVDDDEHQTRYHEPTPHPSISGIFDNAANSSMQSRQHLPLRERPGSASLGNTIQGSLRRALQSRGSEHSPVQSTTSASASNVSSTVSSDTEHTVGTTALPNYEREVRHRERREAAKAQIQQQVEEAKLRKEEKKGNLRVKTPLQALRKRKEKEGKEGKGDREERSGTRRGVDMSHV